MIRHLLIAFCMLMLLLISACSEQEPQVEGKQPASKEGAVVVPTSVAGKWKSVKIALYDQQEKTENIYQIDIGGNFQIPGSNMRVKVESFMPAFSVNSERATSASNQLSNPAVLIVVSDGEKEIHRDWVFGLYPDRHQFADPRYKFLLLGYKPQR